MTLVIVAVAVAAAVATSLSRTTEYQAAASYALERTPSNAQIGAVIAQRTAALAGGEEPLRAKEQVAATTTPGSSTVTIYAHAASRERARELADNYTADLLGIERRVDRPSLANQISALEQRIAALPRGRPGEAGKALTARLHSLQARQITDADFRPVEAVVTTRAKAPLRHALYSLPVALLIAFAAGVALDLLATARRRPSPA